MFRNPFAASVVLSVALLSISSAAKAEPPNPMPNDPPRTLQYEPPNPIPEKPPLAVLL